MVFEWDLNNANNTDSKKYVKSIIHAGAPENFVYYFTTNDDSYRAEYLLSGGERQTSYNKLSDNTTTINARDWQEYIDTNQSNLIADKTVGGLTKKDIHILTYNEAYEIWEDTATIRNEYNNELYATLDSRIKTGAYYWLATGNGLPEGWSWEGLKLGIKVGTLGVLDIGSLGIRPVITLKSGVYVEVDENHDGSGNKKFVLHMDSN